VTPLPAPLTNQVRQPSPTPGQICGWGHSVWNSSSRGRIAGGCEIEAV